jgi:hypothetical protein
MTLSFVATPDAGLRASLGCAVLAALAATVPDILDRLPARCSLAESSATTANISTSALQDLQARLPFDPVRAIDDRGALRKRFYPVAYAS